MQERPERNSNEPDFFTEKEKTLIHAREKINSLFLQGKYIESADKEDRFDQIKNVYRVHSSANKHLLFYFKLELKYATNKLSIQIWNSEANKLLDTVDSVDSLKSYINKMPDTTVEKPSDVFNKEFPSVLDTLKKNDGGMFRGNYYLCTKKFLSELADKQHESSEMMRLYNLLNLIEEFRREVYPFIKWYDLAENTIGGIRNGHLGKINSKYTLHLIGASRDTLDKTRRNQKYKQIVNFADLLHPDVIKFVKDVYGDENKFEKKLVDMHETLENYRKKHPDVKPITIDEDYTGGEESASIFQKATDAVKKSIESWEIRDKTIQRVEDKRFSAFENVYVVLDNSDRKLFYFTVSVSNVKDESNYDLHILVVDKELKKEIGNFRDINSLEKYIKKF